MAISTFYIKQNLHERIFDVTATADTDTASVINHGFGKSPRKVSLTPLSASGIISEWRIALGVQDVTLTKSTAAGSGSATAQLRVELYPV